MAKTKAAKSKSKLDFKDLMLKKGEYVVLGVAGLGLLLLLMGGVSTYSEAKDPKKIADGLTSKARNIDSAVTREAEPGAVPKLEDWAVPGGKGGGYVAVPVRDFAQSGVMFDPTARPDTKRENPRVMGIGVYQVDLVRAPMKAHDIVYDPDGGAKIAVRVVKKQSDADKAKVKDAIRAIKAKGSAGNKVFKAATQPQPQPGVAPPAGVGPMGGQPPRGGSGGGPPPGMVGPGGEGGIPGGEGGGFNQAGFRVETTINYIPLDALDTAAAEGKLPAMTVIPLRMAVVNATFPFKAQAEEMKRALRMKTAGEAAPFVKFDGFDVKRRVVAPDGTVVGTGKKYAEVAANPKDDGTLGWYDYRYIDKYQELIASRMLNSHVEGADPKDKSGVSAYLPYFYRYEDNLVMFLPELVPELGQYPEVKLAPILETVQKMKDATTAPVTKSAVLERLTGKGKGKDGDSPRTGIFLPTNAAATPGLGSIYGSAAGGMMMPAGKGGEGGEGGTLQTVPAGVDIDNILIRFIDPDVRPGYTYEYMMRVRLINPNFGNPKSMSNPVLAGEAFKVLPGPWTRLTQSLTVPAESFVFAYDPAKYDEEVKGAYTRGPLLDRFKLPAGNTHTVVQKLSWLEQVRVDQGNQREPIGAWVAAEMPVPRGGFVGRKTYVKLPLWSSEENRYTLREAPAEKVGKGKDAAAPKGWMVDFSGRDILVDFDGGKVTTRVGSKTVVEDVATELLIARPDGRLTVRSSAADMANPERVRNTAEWAKWQSDVESGATTGTGTGGNDPFGRPPAKN